ncbi:MAG: 30S ribosomal protein S16 [Candidatus Omnitrophica bacterium]|nr:30S ribosomal protein S16 [Candidatus Omnitrophota bacterium]
MAVHIRLRRIGKNPKKRPYFRVTVFDERTNRDGRLIEQIGSYNPVTGSASIKQERFDYWVKNGAVPSLTVKNLVKKLNKIK